MWKKLASVVGTLAALSWVCSSYFQNPAASKEEEGTSVDPGPEHIVEVSLTLFK